MKAQQKTDTLPHDDLGRGAYIFLREWERVTFYFFKDLVISHSCPKIMLSSRHLCQVSPPSPSPPVLNISGKTWIFGRGT